MTSHNPTLYPQEHDKGLTDAQLVRETDKAKILKEESESYGNTIKDIINTVSKAQVTYHVTGC